MIYFKATLEDGNFVYLESKTFLNDNRVIRELIDSGELTPHDSVISVDQVDEEEFEESHFN